MQKTALPATAPASTTPSNERRREKRRMTSPYGNKVGQIKRHVRRAADFVLIAASTKRNRVAGRGESPNSLALAGKFWIIISRVCEP